LRQGPYTQTPGGGNHDEHENVHDNHLRTLLIVIAKIIACCTGRSLARKNTGR
jgi:hypothetical protein